MTRLATIFLITAIAAGFVGRAQAWSDAPLCMAQPPAHDERGHFESEAELMCAPEQTFESQGPLWSQGPIWTAPISAAEARRAMREVDALAQHAPADALLKLRVVERAMPRIADRVGLRRGALLIQLGRPEEACDAYRLAADSPERNVAAEGRIGLVRCMLEAGKRQGEVELEKVCRRYPRLGERYALEIAQARARESWNNKQGAVALYRTIDLNAPETHAAAEAREALARLRIQGVRVQPYTSLEIVERAERVVERGSVEAGRSAIADLLTMSALPLPLKGRAHLLAARFARLEGRWDTVREEANLALGCGVPAGEALRLMPRAAAENEEDGVAQGEIKVRKLLAGRPIRRLKTPQLRGVLDIALQHRLVDVASEVLSAMAARATTMPPQARFDAAVLAFGVASDESVLSVFEGLRELRPFRVSASYHHARALERLGRNEEAREEYHLVVDLDDGATRYYGIWAQARLTGFEQMATGSCRRDESGTCLPDTGLQMPADAVANPRDGTLPNLAAFPGLSTVFAEREPNNAKQDANARRTNIVARLGALASTYGAAFPWLGRAADLAELELYDDAAAEIGETYLAYRDARGGLRVRAGVEAVLTNSAPPRHAAAGTLRRDRLALDGAARLALADVADLLDEPGIAVRLRDQRGEPRPRAYAADVEQAAAKYGIDPNLLFAVMRVESVYYRHIVSFAGAVGLMQIMPRTGMRIARALGVQDFDTLDLLDPRKNLEFAAWYLSSLIQRFDGRLPLAIASYNGGPHNVRLWLSRHPQSMPLDAFLERIPFTETHRYVRRVLTHYAAYRAQQNLPMPNLAVSLPRLQPDVVAF